MRAREKADAFFRFLKGPRSASEHPPNFRGGASKLPRINSAQAGGVTGSPGTQDVRRVVYRQEVRAFANFASFD